MGSTSGFSDNTWWVLGGFDKLLLAFFGTLLGAQRILGDETCPLDNLILEALSTTKIHFS